MRSIRHWRTCISRLFRGERPRRRRRPSSFSALEALEQRVLLTSFLVTTTEDVVADDGQVSLREAVQAANSNTAVGDAVAGEADGDVIRFSEALASAEIILSLGELAITEDLVINGQLSSDVIQINANEQSRAFHINTSEDVTIENMTLVYGSTNGLGGLIAVIGGGTTQMFSVTVHRGRAAVDGGGLYNEDSTVIIENSVFTENYTVENNGGNGSDEVDGAILNGVGGRLRITHTLISGNFTTGIKDISESGLNVVLNEVTLGENSDGGLLVVGGSNVLIEDSTIRGNGNYTVDFGSGLWNGLGRMTVRRSSITDNQDVGIGNSGGILDISECVIAENNLGPGGGIVSHGGTVIVTDSTIRGNTGTDHGGGIDIIGGALRLVSSLVANNRGSLDFRYTVMGGGGGIFLHEGTKASIEHCTIQGNQGGSNGGGLWISAGSSAQINNSVIKGNSCTEHGGGIFNDGGVLAIANSVIFGNHVTGHYAEGRYTPGAPGYGGGIFSNFGRVVLHSSIVRSNFAMGSGGGMAIKYGQLAITGNSNVVGNVAGVESATNFGNGGGIYLWGNGSVAHIHDTAIARNNAANEGGGIWLYGTIELNMVRSIVADNRAYGFQGGRGGGGILSNGGTLLLIKTAIARNFTTRHGGGLLLAAGSSTRIVDSRIDNNDAGRVGGGIVNDGELELEDALVRFNTARAGGGVFTGIAGSTTLENSVVSGNIPNNFAGPGQVV